MPKKIMTGHKLPSGVSVHGANYTYRYRINGTQKRVTLCPYPSPLWKVEASLNTFLNGPKITLNDLIDDYLASYRFKDLKVTTRRDYEGAIKQIRAFFGNRDPRKITTKIVQQYMNKRSSKKRANVERTVLMNVYRWAVAHTEGIEHNPTLETIPFPMKARNRYITDEEYQKIWAVASKPVQIAMDLSYLLAARQGDVLNLKWSDVTEDGVYIKQGKTGKAQIKAMNDDLQSVLDKAKDKKIRSMVYVVSNRSGQQYTAYGFRCMWKKAKLKAGIKDVTFHDIKAKSISDFEGDKQLFSGHKSRGQMERYNRTPDKVESGRFKE